MRKALLTILTGIICCMVFTGCKNGEAFSDVRAHRTGTDTDTEDNSEVDTINISFTDNVQPASVWIITDTESNRHTSVWGTAMMKPEELGKEYSAGIPKAEDDKYLFRMIDEDGIYYATEINELQDGWKLVLYDKDGEWDIHLEIYDDNDELVQESSVFNAAL